MSEPILLGEALNRILISKKASDKGLGRLVSSIKIHEVLNDRLRFYIERGVKLKCISNKKIFLICHKDVIRNDIFHRKKEILNAVNSEFGGEKVVEDLILSNF